MLRRPGRARSLDRFRQNRLMGKSGSAGLLIFRACTVHESSSSLAKVLSMAHSPPVNKAVIPAAGLGTRFVPATKAMPKEMLPVIDGLSSTSSKRRPRPALPTYL